MISLSPRLVADLIGKPYRDQARGPDSYDCEGLFLEVQRRRGYTLPAPLLDGTRGRARAWMRVAGHCWQQLDAPRPGCAVFFPSELHVGTMYDRQRFLHTSSEFGSAFLDMLDAPQWRAKTPQFYDWTLFP